MRVLSWNIELGQNLEQAATELASIAELRDPDIVLIQEMDDVGASELASALGMDHHYWAPANHPKTRRPFGNAVLSRWPIVERSQLALPHTAYVQGQARGATMAVLDVEGTLVTAYSVHLETVLMSVKRRAAQVETLATQIASRKSGPVLVAGDFNAASSRSLASFDRQLETVQLGRATSGDAPTFNRFRRWFALDHMYTRGLRVTATGVAGTAEASDHRPIWANLEVLPG